MRQNQIQSQTQHADLPRFRTHPLPYNTAPAFMTLAAMAQAASYRGKPTKCFNGAASLATAWRYSGAQWLPIRDARCLSSWRLEASVTPQPRGHGSSAPSHLSQHATARYQGPARMVRCAHGVQAKNKALMVLFTAHGETVTRRYDGPKSVGPQ